MNERRIEQLRYALTEALAPERLEVTDESHLHAGHPGARDGRGHFRVDIVSDAFSGLNRVQRHQKVYQAVGDLMKTDVHALAIKA
ncbi:MAG: BolA family transcriptional regulator, partial [Gammaproteobacteria bacterium]|nr:BolA family transcriptional regulator [Gammaproteobacteria bacterium]